VLFELARELVGRTQADPTYPIPVYLPLSSWAVRRPSLVEWLAEQLDELYQVPRQLGRRWIGEARLLFLLDGLDEITDPRARAACVNSINHFGRFGRSYSLPTVVTSRQAEYEALPVRLQLATALRLRPLDADAVLRSMRDLGALAQPVLAAVRGDPELGELLRSPLLVTMLLGAYAGTDGRPVAGLTGSAAEQRHQLITAYVDRQLESAFPTGGSTGRPGTAYPPEHIRRWLAQLARNLARDQQTTLLVGRLPTRWVPARWAQRVVIGLPGVVVGLIVGALLSLTEGGPRIGLESAISAALGAGLAACLILDGGPAGRLRWSWAAAVSRLPSMLAVGAVVAWFDVLLVAVADGWPAGVDDGWRLTVVGLLAGGMAGGLRGLRPGRGIGAAVGLSVALAQGLVSSVGDGPGPGLLAGAGVGLMAAIGAGLAGQPEPADRLTWSWARARSSLRRAAVAGLVAGLLFALAGQLFGVADLNVEQLFWPVFGLLAGVAVGLGGGLSRDEIPSHVTPVDGVRRSVRNGCLSGLASGVGVGLTIGLIAAYSFWSAGPLRADVGSSLLVGLGVGLLVGLVVVGSIVGFAFGLGAAVQNRVLIVLLSAYRLAPLRYVSWLDYTVRLRLLYRGPGGGYVFIHRLVQDYFADEHGRAR
jgi:hypothetical protein